MRRRFAFALPLVLLPLLAFCKADDALDVTITSVSPRTGSARGGEAVVITGSGFDTDSIVLFGDTPAAAVTVQSSGTLLATTPMAVAGDKDITVRAGDKSATAPAGFRFLPLDLAFIDAPSWYLPALDAYDTTAAVAADFDGDGHTDLLVAVRNGQARLLRNSGKGAFTDTAAAGADAGSQDAGADEDAATPDATAAEGGWPSVPDGGLDASPPPQVVSTWIADTRDIVVADLDGDADQDLFLCNGSGQSGRILLNDGTGAFDDAPDGAFPAGSDECRRALLADVDGDGRQDIVLAGNGKVGMGRGYLRVYLRGSDEGHPSFSAPAALEPAAEIAGLECGSTGVSAPELTATATLSRDKAAGGETSCAVAFDASAGTGTIDLSFPIPALAALPDSVAFDVQGDATGTAVKLAVTDAKGEAFHFDAGSLSNTAWKHVQTGKPSTWTPSGTDSDGVVDLPLSSLTLSFTPAAGSTSGTLHVDEIRLQVPGAGAVLIDDFERIAFPASWVHSVAWVSAGDLDQDGDDDFSVASEAQGGAPVSLVLNERQGGAAPNLRSELSPALAALPAPVSCTALLDADGDGDLDIVAVSSTEQDRLLVNDGRAHFFDDTLASMPLDRSPGRFVDAADLDMDLLPDLVIANDGAVNRLYVQHTSHGFIDSTPSIPLRETRTLRLVPLDAEGDGDVDLFVLNRKGEVSSLYVSAAPATHSSGR